MRRKVNTIFLGSNWEAAQVLEKCLEIDWLNIVCVITKRDAKVGRKQVITPNIVKQIATANEIPFFHTNSDSKRYQLALDTYKPELNICLSFGEIVPEFFLMNPEFKSINIHYSLLPKYRGAVPIQGAILNDEKETGITFTQMVAGMDAGGILSQYKIPIDIDDTNITLRQKLLDISCEKIEKDLKDWIDGKAKLVDQDKSKVSFCYMKDIAKENSFVSFEDMNALEIHNKVRAFQPWPTAKSTINGINVKVHSTSISNLPESLENEFIQFKERRLFIQCNHTDHIEILEIQPEGKVKMDAISFYNGYLK